MGKAEQEFEVCPFTVVIDSNEGAPWLFREFKKNKLPLVIKTVNKALWSIGKMSFVVDGQTHIRGLADYSIDGLEQLIQIERKSVADLFGTLGFRRSEFEAEMMRLSMCDFACVIVEGGWGHIAEGVRESKLLPSSVKGTILAWNQRYPKVHWYLAGNKAMAEKLAFEVLERFWKDRQK